MIQNIYVLLATFLPEDLGGLGFDVFVIRFFLWLQTPNFVLLLDSVVVKPRGICCPPNLATLFTKPYKNPKETPNEL